MSARADRASEIVREGDPEAILKMAMGAWFAADEGRFCERAEPILHGRDLMCGRCLLENEGQRERKEALMRGPHPFEAARPGSGAARLGWCGICVRPADDPRHRAGVVEGTHE